MYALPSGTRLSRQSLREILDSIQQTDPADRRARTRIELVIPTEIQTSKGNMIRGTTREISRFGVGLLHQGPIFLGEAAVKIMSDSREYCYQVAVEWCKPCGDGMFQSGCRFLTKPVIDNASGHD